MPAADYRCTEPVQQATLCGMDGVWRRPQVSCKRGIFLDHRHDDALMDFQ
jgi:hypothetical protein